MRITIHISDFSSLSSYFAAPSATDTTYESQALVKDKYGNKERLEFKVTKNRMKRLKTQAKMKVASLEEILNFKFPLLSKIFYVVPHQPTATLLTPSSI